MQPPANFFIQFIRFAGGFWRSKDKIVIWEQSLALIALTILQIVLAVFINKSECLIVQCLRATLNVKFYNANWRVGVNFCGQHGGDHYASYGQT